MKSYAFQDQFARFGPLPPLWHHRPMRCNFVAMWPSNSPLAQSWLQKLPDYEVILVGSAALALRGDHHRNADGRAIGCLSGALCNDVALRDALAARGLAIELPEHCKIATEIVGSLGPGGLGLLRWQGALAVAHLGQRQMLLARDAMGVGQLWASIGPEATCIASDRALLTSVVGPDMPSQSVPAGLVVQISDRGLQWLPLQVSPENRAFFRDIPPDVQQIQSDQLLDHLAQFVALAAQSLARGLGGLTRLPANHLQQQWLAELVPWESSEEGNGLWTLRGTESLLGFDPEEQCAVQSGPWPAIDPPEPTERAVDAATRKQRIWRATCLADRLLLIDHGLAREMDRHLVAPQLDAPVLAYLGAWQFWHPTPAGS